MVARQIPAAIAAAPIQHVIAALTGGNGFIGQALASRLVADGRFAEVRVLTRRDRAPPGTRRFAGDLLADPLEAFVDGADVLFHCAGEVRRTDVMRAVHVEGTRRLARAARRRVRRWVQLSSVGAYGHRLMEGTINEQSPLDPEGEYEETKVESDALVLRAANESDFQLTVLRPSTVFGPAMPNRSLYQLVRAIERGWFFFVGRGAIATYVYVDDVAEALVACALAAQTGVYNLSDDRTMENFVGAIAEELGTPRPRRRLPYGVARSVAKGLGWLPQFPLRESRIRALARGVRYPSDRIRHELGFSFQISIERGLQRLIAARAG